MHDVKVIFIYCIVSYYKLKSYTGKDLVYDWR